jgi:hypothetical protein
LSADIDALLAELDVDVQGARARGDGARVAALEALHREATALATEMRQVTVAQNADEADLDFGRYASRLQELARRLRDMGGAGG